jgi:hypothetical protein
VVVAAGAAVGAVAAGPAAGPGRPAAGLDPLVAAHGQPAVVLGRAAVIDPRPAERVLPAEPLALAAGWRGPAAECRPAAARRRSAGPAAAPADPPNCPPVAPE